MSCSPEGLLSLIGQIRLTKYEYYPLAAFFGLPPSLPFAVEAERLIVLSEFGILRQSAAAALIQHLLFVRFRQFSKPDLLHDAITIDEKQSRRPANL